MLARFTRAAYPRSQNVATPPTLAIEGASAFNEPSREVDMRRIWSTLLRRRKLMILVLFGFVAAVLVFTLIKPRMYTTEVKMIAGFSNLGSSTEPIGTQLPILNALLSASSGQSAETYAELMQQSPVVQDVIASLRLKTSVGALLKQTTIRPVTDTSILSLRVAWTDPVSSARIANAFATTFVERERHLVARQAETAIGYLSQQLPDAQAHMAAAQAALSAYQVKSGIADLPSQTQSDINTVSALEAREQQAELDAQQDEAQLAVVRRDLASTAPTVIGQQSTVNNPVVGTLQAQIAQLQGQLDAARAQYTEAHPTVVNLKMSLAAAERELRGQPEQISGGSSTGPNPAYEALQSQATTLETAAAGARSEVATLRRQREAFRPRLQHLPEQARRIGDLQREAKTTEAVYEALSHKYQEAVIARTTALSDVTITQAADPNVYAVSPNLTMNLIIGALAGLGLALVIGLGADFLDNRFRSENDVRERLGLPVLATVPQIESNDWRANQWVKPLSVEAFYQLVAALRYSSDKQPRSIAFVSPDQGDGKSTVAINTAISMALMKAKVLLIDGDLRRPSIHQKLNVPNDRGLSDVLVGIAKFPSVVKSTRHANLWVLTAGRPAPNPVALLQSAAYDRLLKRAAERFDYIIIDTPALRSIVDGAVLARKADGTVMVVSAQRSDTRAMETALMKLHGLGADNVLGAVLNGAKPEAHNVGYYAGARSTVPIAGAASAG